MNTDVSSYTVTSPDLLMIDHGITVMVVSTDDNFIDATKRLFEKYIVNSIVFCVQDKKTTEKNMAWPFYVSRQCDYMIIDVDNSEWIDVCIAFTLDIEEKNIVFVSSKDKKKDLKILVNTIGKIPVLNGIEYLEDYILNEIVKV